MCLESSLLPFKVVGIPMGIIQVVILRVYMGIMATLKYGQGMVDLCIYHSL